MSFPASEIQKHKNIQMPIIEKIYLRKFNGIWRDKTEKYGQKHYFDTFRLWNLGKQSQFEDLGPDLDFEPWHE